MAGAKGQSGGARLGAGRRKKNFDALVLSGGAKASERPKLAPVAFISAPDGLREDEKLYWDTWAPYACRARTLTAATAEEFRALCEMVIECEALLLERRREGWTARGLALLREYRSLRMRIEVGRRAFQLAPVGKPMDETDGAPADPFATFDGSVQ